MYSVNRMKAKGQLIECKVTIGAKVDPAVRRWLEHAAKQSGLTVSAYIAQWATLAFYGQPKQVREHFRSPVPTRRSA